MNHSCAVIGVAANLTQWTPPRMGQTDGQTEKFNIISLRFTGDNQWVMGIANYCTNKWVPPAAAPTSG